MDNSERELLQRLDAELTELPEFQRLRRPRRPGDDHPANIKNCAAQEAAGIRRSPFCDLFSG